MSQNQNEIDRTLAGGLTVAQLIEALEDLPDDAVVVFGSDYGDICHTEQALVVGRVDEIDSGTERIETSAYSHSGIAIEPIVDAAECDDDTPAAEDASRRGCCSFAAATHSGSARRRLAVTSAACRANCPAKPARCPTTMQGSSSSATGASNNVRSRLGNSAASLPTFATRGWFFGPPPLANPSLPDATPPNVGDTGRELRAIDQVTTLVPEAKAELAEVNEANTKLCVLEDNGFTEAAHCGNHVGATRLFLSYRYSRTVSEWWTTRPNRGPLAPGHDGRVAADFYFFWSKSWRLRLPGVNIRL